MIGDTSAAEGRAEAPVSFWGDPFMAAHHDRRAARSIIHVRERSAWIGPLREVERAFRAAGRHGEAGAAQRPPSSTQASPFGPRM